jgi:hypothetical protein
VGIVPSNSRVIKTDRPWALGAEPYQNRTSPLRDLWLRHMVPFTALGSEAKRPVPGKFKVQVNAWLLEDFDPNAQPIKVIDAKTLW